MGPSQEQLDQCTPAVSLATVGGAAPPQASSPGARRGALSADWEPAAAPALLPTCPPQLCVPHSFIFSFYYALEHLGDLLFLGHFWVNFDFCPLCACLFFFHLKGREGQRPPTHGGVTPQKRAQPRSALAGSRHHRASTWGMGPQEGR